MKSVVLCILMLSILYVPTLQAQWIENGVALCTADARQANPEIAADGAGGAIVAWADYRNGTSSDIYAQRIDAAGHALWATNGIAICTAAYDQSYPQVVSDGAGGAIILWEDKRISRADIFLQRVDASGDVLWTAGGVAVSLQIASRYLPQIVSDGSNGAVIAWSGSGAGVYAQRLDAAGNRLWTDNGIVVSAAGTIQSTTSIASDGAGGAIIAWNDFRDGNYDIYAQRVDAAGNVLWTANGFPVCTAAYDQIAAQIVSDGSSGAILAWQDYRIAAYPIYWNIYAQRVDASGSVLWTANGIPICTENDVQESCNLVSDGAGGAVITWSDNRVSASNADIYAQRVNGAGTVLWTPGGVPVCMASGIQWYPQIVSDDASGAIITWKDYRFDPNGDYFAQRMDSSGSALWTADGEAVCTATNAQELGRIASDGAGGAIVVWYDRRSIVSLHDIYAQRMERHGYWGYPAADIAHVRDISIDQGGFVEIVWDASRLDALPDATISRYTIWRRSDEPDFRWELIDSIEAIGTLQYADTVQTLSDSTAAGPALSYFQVIAHTSDPETFWISTPDSGSSIDNLAPMPPSGLAGGVEDDPPGLRLKWNSNTAPDLSHYAVYRGLSVDFIPQPENRIASPIDTSCFDGEWSPASGWYYKVSAIDVHGNESGFALLTPDAVTGAEAPGVTYLSQNFPNPFNPTTRICFGLRAPTDVRLTICTVSGQRIRTVVEGRFDAGSHVVTWNGRDDKGNTVASGIYFYRLMAGSFIQTKKMVLLR